jgi:hypothetical protein
MSKENNENIDVLIVCGQGVYLDGKYYSEYPDHNVYLEHAISVKEIFRKFNYTHIVCSGGYTQKDCHNQKVENTSEAKSFLKIWEDTNSKPNTKNIIYDEYALDSTENIILGLISLRNSLNNEGLNPTIRRIGAYSAWQFKKKRFNNLAKELEIINQFYFHGFANADKAQSGDLALNGEKKFLDETKNDPFLISSNAEMKKKNRLKKETYSDRLVILKDSFSNLFNQFDNLKICGGIRNQINFIDAFKLDIIQGKKLC